MQANRNESADAPLIADLATELRRALQTATDFQNHIERNLSAQAPARGAPAFAPTAPLPDWPVAADASGVVGECIERTRKWIDAWNDPRQGPGVLLSRASEPTAMRMRRDWIELGRGVLADMADAVARWERTEGMNRRPSVPPAGRARPHRVGGRAPIA